MKKTPCLYSIVRFTPFVETGEFANAGIIMMAPEQRYFEFKLLTQRHARVTHFFEQLEAKVYKATMRNLGEELRRAAGLLRQHGFDKRLKTNDVDFARRLFTEIIRPRETVIKFSEPRAILAADLAETLAELYSHYVERTFVTREYQEAVLERGMRKWLYQARIVDRFDRLEVGDAEYHVTFPFVEQRADHAVKAIKPLHLAHDQPTKIIEHGGQWLFRIGQLRKRNQLPDMVLFAVCCAGAGGGWPERAGFRRDRRWPQGYRGDRAALYGQGTYPGLRGRKRLGIAAKEGDRLPTARGNWMPPVALTPAIGSSPSRFRAVAHA